MSVDEKTIRELKSLLWDRETWLSIRQDVIDGNKDEQAAAYTVAMQNGLGGRHLGPDIHNRLLAAVQEHLEDLLDERDALLAELEATEWGTECWCPRCHGTEPGPHAPNCSMGRLLRRPECC